MTAANNIATKETICLCKGGSRAYGLNGPDSDEDIRGVYVCRDLGYILGVDAGKKAMKFEDLRDDEADIFLFEFRHFLDSLRKTNTQALELLYNQHWDYVSDFWPQVVAARQQLINTDQLFTSLTGYMYGERRLMIGERTGLLGSKRKQALETYGYSYKNAVQLLRLAYAGEVFFQTGVFPVDLTGTPVYDQIRDIKFHPGHYTLDEITPLVDEAEARMHDSYFSHKVEFHFDEDVANRLCLEAYRRHLDAE